MPSYYGDKDHKISGKLPPRFEQGRGAIGGIINLCSIRGIDTYGVNNAVPKIREQVQAIGSAPCVLTIIGGTLLISEDYTFPSNIAVRGHRGGFFNIATGKTLTFAGGFFSDDNAQHFDGLGTPVFSTTSGAVINGAWFGLTPDGNITDGSGTDNATALNAMFTSARLTAIAQVPNMNNLFNVVPISLKIPNGVYAVNDTIWAGADRDGGDAIWQWDLITEPGTTILGRCTNKPILDMSGVANCRLENLTICGDETATPQSGILLARSGDTGGADSAGVHVFRNVRVYGKYRHYSVENLTSEWNRWVNCDFLNTGGYGAMFYDFTNRRAHLRSPNTELVNEGYGGTTNPATTPQFDTFTNCEFNHNINDVWVRTEEIDDTASGTWGVTGDFTAPAGVITYSYAADKTSEATQTAANRLSTAKNSKYYKLDYEVNVTTAISSGHTFTLETFGNEAVTLPLHEGRHSVKFISAAGADVAAFTLRMVTSGATQGAFTLTLGRLSLMEMPAFHDYFDILDVADGDWTVTNDFAYTGGTATWTYGTDVTSTLVQTAANRAIAGDNAKKYCLSFTYTAGGTPPSGITFTIEDFFDETITWTPVAGVNEIWAWAHASASTQPLTIKVVASSGAGSFTLEDIELFQEQAALISINSAAVGQWDNCKFNLGDNISPEIRFAFSPGTTTACRHLVFNGCQHHSTGWDRVTVEDTVVDLVIRDCGFDNMQEANSNIALKLLPGAILLHANVTVPNIWANGPTGTPGSILESMVKIGGETDVTTANRFIHIRGALEGILFLPEDVDMRFSETTAKFTRVFLETGARVTRGQLTVGPNASVQLLPGQDYVLINVSGSNNTTVTLPDIVPANVGMDVRVVFNSDPVGATGQAIISAFSGDTIQFGSSSASGHTSLRCNADGANRYEHVRLQAIRSGVWTVIDSMGFFGVGGRAGREFTPVSATGTGTVTTDGTTAVVGSGTSFTTECFVGNRIKIAGTLYTVAAITNDTNLTTATGVPLATGVAFSVPFRYTVKHSDTSLKVNLTSDNLIAFTLPALDVATANGWALNVVLESDGGTGYITIHTTGSDRLLSDGIRYTRAIAVGNSTEQSETLSVVRAGANNYTVIANDGFRLAGSTDPIDATGGSVSYTARHTDKILRCAMGGANTVTITLPDLSDDNAIIGTDLSIVLETDGAGATGTLTVSRSGSDSIMDATTLHTQAQATANGTNELETLVLKRVTGNGYAVMFNKGFTLS